MLSIPSNNAVKILLITVSPVPRHNASSGVTWQRDSCEASSHGEERIGIKRGHEFAKKSCSAKIFLFRSETNLTLFRHSFSTLVFGLRTFASLLEAWICLSSFAWPSRGSGSCILLLIKAIKLTRTGLQLLLLRAP